MVLPRSLDETRKAAQLGESLGFSWISVADSPTVYQDSYLHQLEVARAAPSVHVGPMVSHVVIRHPVVVGNLLSTLNHFTDGRAIGTLATGNSAARGLGLKPATIADIADAVEAIQSYWRGDGGTFRDSQIPVTGLKRDACPLLVAADGPKTVALSGRVGDGLLYGGTIDPEVRRRRLAACRAGGEDRQAWVAPTVSVKTTHEDVRDDLGAMVVAMANRAMRGDLDERGVPPKIQEDVLEMRRVYDYGFHADNTRPRNAQLVSDRLTRFLIDTLCIWGDESRFKATLEGLAADGWTGVMFILGQGEQVSVVQALGERLQHLGYLRPTATV